MVMGHKVVNTIFAKDRNFEVVAFWDRKTPDDIEFWEVYTLRGALINPDPFRDHEPTAADIAPYL